MNLSSRPRRLRKSDALRHSLAEIELNASRLVYPVFVAEEPEHRSEIQKMPGQFRWGTKKALGLIQEAFTQGIRSFAIFPVIEDRHKDAQATRATDPDHFHQRLLQDLKQHCPEAVLYSDIALDPYSSDGHDGLVQNGQILNDETVEILARMALLHARAGVDFVSPSDMMDGRVGVIRQALDENGFHDTGIMSYSAKYASAFYGPFRDALQSAPRFGDKKTYQMDPRNRREARREIRLDLEEGADIVMVKPALAYLDLIQDARDISDVPVAAYNVSGEYAMIKFAAQAGALNEQAAALESLLAIRRAGADLIFSYWALQAVRWL